MWQYGPHFGVDGDSLDLMVKVGTCEDGLEPVVFFLFEARHKMGIGHANAVLVSLDDLDLEGIYPTLCTKEKTLENKLEGIAMTIKMS